MKAALALAGWWLLQMAGPANGGPAADPRHLRYNRAVELPPNASGQACVVLDASVFAHAGSAGANDLRLFAEQAGKASETPFNLSESESSPVEVDTAEVRNLGMRGGDIVFDLEMPRRAYTDVELVLGTRNFLGVAKVAGTAAHGGPATELGSYVVFDLSRQGLSRSTTLTLQESTFAELQVRLHLTALDGRPLPDLQPPVVEGARVPPSREAQTLYTTVARTPEIAVQGRFSVAKLDVPAHVPVERVRFELQPSYTANFLRAVTVAATPHARGSDAIGAAEAVSGEISRVLRAAGEGQPALHHEQLSVEATLGSTLQTPATVTVSVNNGDDAPLGLKAVDLEMRRRMICFDAESGKVYTLRYGDAALHAPVYDYARLFQPSVQPVMATLGPERLNADFRARTDDRPYTERHPELLWIGLLVVVGALGTTALESVKRQGKRR